MGGSASNITITGVGGAAGISVTGVGSAANIVITSPETNIAPTVDVNPVIAGTPGIGNTYTATTGTYSGNPTPTVTGQWLRDGVAIVGETGLTYTQVADDIGPAITYRETATNAAGSVQATSNALSWDPDDFAPDSWLDSSAAGVLWQDAAGTVPADATSDPVGRWDESQTGGGNWTQRLSPNRPELQADGGIRGDGNDDYFTRNASLIVPTTEGVTYYWAAVVTPSESPQSIPMFFDEANYATRGPTLGFGEGGFLVSFGNASNSNINSVGGKSYTPGEKYLFEAEVAIQAGDVGTIKGWVNGVLELDTTGNFSGSDAVLEQPTRLLMQRKSISPTRSHRGSIFELFYFDTPAAAVPANLRAYLQNKWGL